MAGLGRAFVREGVRWGYDGRLLVALAYAETEAGKYPPSQAKHNPFGWGADGGRVPGGVTFPSWEAAIKTVARGVRRGYIDRGQDTIATMADQWLGREDDLAQWIYNVRWVYRHLGGTHPIVKEGG